MEISYLLVIAAITILVSFLWAATVAFTVWDVYRRDLTGVELLIWVGLAVLLPFFGFGLYLLSRGVTGLISPQDKYLKEGRLRSTALKRTPEAGRAMPTFMAADLAKETVAEPVGNIFPPAAAPTGLPRFRCYVLEGPCLGQVFSVEALPAYIGRGPEAAIRLDQDLGVSRRHAEVYERSGTLWIKDLESTHGTKVNGAWVKGAPLGAGDRVQVGASVLRFDFGRQQPG